MFEFTGMASCCPTGLSSYWLMCLHRDSTWHPVTGHLNWHPVNGPLIFYCFHISDYLAGNIYVRRSLPSSWSVGSLNSNKNEVSIDLVCKSLFKNKFVLCNNANRSWHMDSIPLHIVYEGCCFVLSYQQARIKAE
jgi:hypothetical protein